MWATVMCRRQQGPGKLFIRALTTYLTYLVSESLSQGPAKSFTVPLFWSGFVLVKLSLQATTARRIRVPYREAGPSHHLPCGPSTGLPRHDLLYRLPQYISLHSLAVLVNQDMPVDHHPLSLNPRASDPQPVDAATGV